MAWPTQFHMLIISPARAMAGSGLPSYGLGVDARCLFSSSCCCCCWWPRCIAAASAEAAADSRGMKPGEWGERIVGRYETQHSSGTHACCVVPPLVVLAGAHSPPTSAFCMQMQTLEHRNAAPTRTTNANNNHHLCCHEFSPASLTACATLLRAYWSREALPVVVARQVQGGSIRKVNRKSSVVRFALGIGLGLMCTCAK